MFSAAAPPANPEPPPGAAPTSRAPTGPGPHTQPGAAPVVQMVSTRMSQRGAGVEMLTLVNRA